MAYNASYSTSDLSNIFVDILGSGGAEVVQWVGILVLIAVVTYLAVRIKHLGKTVGG